MNTGWSKHSSTGLKSAKHLYLRLLIFIIPSVVVAVILSKSHAANHGIGQPAPFALVSTIVVNKTGDAANLNPNVGCDVDAGAAGEQCTLRAAIQRANSLAGDDKIIFNIPTSDP